MPRALATPWPIVAGALFTAAAGFAGGYALAGRLAQFRIAEADARRIECEHAREQDARAAAEQTAALLAQAQDAEAQAAARLAAAQAAAEKRLRETRREIDALSTGRECIAAPLRLRLNAAIGAADHVPQAAGDAAHAAAGAAADTGDGSGRASTDADIAGWIVDAAGLYEQCRERLDALRHWDALTFGGR